LIVLKIDAGECATQAVAKAASSRAIQPALSAADAKLASKPLRSSR